MAHQQHQGYDDGYGHQDYYQDDQGYYEQGGYGQQHDGYYDDNGYYQGHEGQEGHDGYQDGYYEAQPASGLAAARMAALLTYRCREKTARVAVVQPNAQGDSSDEENPEDEDEDPDVEDSEILEEFPDDAEVSCDSLVPVPCGLLTNGRK